MKVRQAFLIAWQAGVGVKLWLPWWRKDRASVSMPHGARNVPINCCYNYNCSMKIIRVHWRFLSISKETKCASYKLRIQYLIGVPVGEKMGVLNREGSYLSYAQCVCIFIYIQHISFELREIYMKILKVS